MDLVLGERRKLGQKKNQLTWVATYAREAGVTQAIPWMRVLPDHIALGSRSTELSDVKICLYAYNTRISTFHTCFTSLTIMRRDRMSIHGTQRSATDPQS
jgi:hypothetical protein